MGASRVRYRVRVRFAVWRLMSAVACFSLVLGLVHDAVIDWEKEVPWSVMAAWLVFCLLVAAMIGIELIKLARFVRNSLIHQKNDLRSSATKPDPAARSDVNV
jgi:hypothetical protein